MDIVDQETWTKARLNLLAEEKALQTARDKVAEMRRDMPWVPVKEDYRFTSEKGQVSLPALFADHSQLIVQHFMMGDGWDAGCPSCSFWADGFDGTLAHLSARGTAFAAVSSAPLDQITAYRDRMGWTFPWVSCAGSRFNQDFGVTFEGHGDTTDPGEDACREQTRGWLESVMSLFDKDPELLTYLSDRLVENGESVPGRTESFRLDAKPRNLAEDRSWLDAELASPDEVVVPARFEPTSVPLVVIPDRQSELKQRVERDDLDRSAGRGPAALARLHTASIDARPPVRVYVNVDCPTMLHLLDARHRNPVGAMRALTFLRSIKTLMVAADHERGGHSDLRTAFEDTLAVLDGLLLESDDA